MSKTFRPWDMQQDFLLPPSLLVCLPEHHLARFVVDVVEELDVGFIDGTPAVSAHHQTQRLHAHLPVRAPPGRPSRCGLFPVALPEVADGAGPAWEIVAVIKGESRP